MRYEATQTVLARISFYKEEDKVNPYIVSEEACEKEEKFRTWLWSNKIHPESSHYSGAGRMYVSFRACDWPKVEAWLLLNGVKPEERL